MVTIEDERKDERNKFKEQIKSQFKSYFDFMLMDIVIHVLFTTCIMIAAYGRLSPMAHWQHKSVMHMVADGHYSGYPIDEVRH